MLINVLVLISMSKVGQEGGEEKDSKFHFGHPKNTISKKHKLYFTGYTYF